MNEKTAIEKIRDMLDDEIIEDFDFELEYWDSGNYDDCFYYGQESGAQAMLRRIREILNDGAAE